MRAFAVLTIAMCATVVGLAEMPEAKAAGRADAGAGGVPGIATIFLAQHHVLEPDNPLFKLIGTLDAVIKAQVYAAPPCPSPTVQAKLTLDGRTLLLQLKGPAMLPPPPTIGEPRFMMHSYADSFTAVIPGAWVAPGLNVAIELLDAQARVLDRRDLGQLKVGAPNAERMTMFDIHYFGDGRGEDYPAGWFEQLVVRLPVAGMELQRVRNIVFDEVVMLPRSGVPATRSPSREGYLEKTGVVWDGKQAIALRWNRALLRAAGPGPGGTRRLFYVNIYGVPAGGQGGGYQGVGSGTRPGVLIHELGHAFGLPDLWKPTPRYPYFGPMQGIAPWHGQAHTPHVGPSWAFDPVRKVFLSPLSDEGSFRRDPMGGGGLNREGGPDLYRFFSDFHFSRMRDRIEHNQVAWDAAAEDYRRWDPKTAAFSLPATMNAVAEAGADDAEVISLLGSASLVTREANFLYPPIGPYRAGYVRLYNAASPEDRARALASGKTKGNLCLRVTQGGKVSTYLVDDPLDQDQDPLDPSSFHVFAINLPSTAGEVARVELLHTPGVLVNGLPADPKVVARWTGFPADAQRNETVTRTYPPEWSPPRPATKHRPTPDR